MRHLAQPTSLFQAAFEWDKARCGCGKLLTDEVHLRTVETEGKELVEYKGMRVLKEDLLKQKEET